MGWYTPDNDAVDGKSGGDFPLPPAGEYEFKVDEATEKTFKSGNNGITIKLLLDHDGEPWVFDHLVDTPKMQWKIKHFVEAIGFTYDDPPPLEAMYAKSGRANFVHETYDGVTRLKVKDYIVPDDGTANEVGKLPF